mmetsp:Transcript_27123/g.49039  ORF Transcript_27123/g.49039 Transcript_27123/m.49039 type:complete len:249 (+) Transcript_27123:400-1146(+)
MGKSGQNLRMQSACRSETCLIMEVTTSSRAPLTLNCWRVSLRAQSARYTGRPRSRARLAVTWLSSKTMYLEPSASKRSQMVRVRVFHPQSTTKLSDSILAMSAFARLSKPARFSSPLLDLCLAATFAPTLASTGVRAMDSTVVVTSSFDERPEIKERRSAKPKSTKANSPPGASSRPDCSADGPETLNAQLANITTLTFKISSPRSKGKIIVQELAKKRKSREKPTVMKKSPRSKPRKGAMFDSTRCL